MALSLRLSFSSHFLLGKDIDDIMKGGCLETNSDLGMFEQVKLACYLVSWHDAIPPDGQQCRQPRDHVGASNVCVEGKIPS